MLTVVDDLAANLKRGGPSAQETAALEEFDGVACRPKTLRGCKTCEPSSDNRYAGRSHELRTTCSFSRFESVARMRSGSHGSCSIFSKMRS